NIFAIAVNSAPEEEMKLTSSTVRSEEETLIGSE
ncbi:MAG: hypothetical protein XD94_1224, partial [Mesotoga prima]